MNWSLLPYNELPDSYLDTPNGIFGSGISSSGLPTAPSPIKVVNVTDGGVYELCPGSAQGERTTSDINPFYWINVQIDSGIGDNNYYLAMSAITQTCSSGKYADDALLFRGIKFIGNTSAYTIGTIIFTISTLSVDPGELPPEGEELPSSVYTPSTILVTIATVDPQSYAVALDLTSIISSTGAFSITGLATESGCYAVGPVYWITEPVPLTSNVSVITRSPTSYSGSIDASSDLAALLASRSPTAYEPTGSSASTSVTPYTITLTGVLSDGKFPIANSVLTLSNGMTDTTDSNGEFVFGIEESEFTIYWSTPWHSSGSALITMDITGASIDITARPYVYQQGLTENVVVDMTREGNVFRSENTLASGKISQILVATLHVTSTAAGTIEIWSVTEDASWDVELIYAGSLSIGDNEIPANQFFGRYGENGVGCSDSTPIRVASTISTLSIQLEADVHYWECYTEYASSSEYVDGYVTLEAQYPLAILSVYNAGDTAATIEVLSNGEWIDFSWVDPTVYFGAGTTSWSTATNDYYKPTVSGVRMTCEGTLTLYGYCRVEPVRTRPLISRGGGSVVAVDENPPTPAPTHYAAGAAGVGSAVSGMSPPTNRYAASAARRQANNTRMGEKALSHLKGRRR